MKIESVNSSSALERGESPVVETLESRLIAASPALSGNKRPDPEFERLYQQLLAMEGQGEKAIYEFLRALRGADGESPAYPSAKALMAVTLQVLVRLKDEGLEKSRIYSEVSGANGLAFSMDLFVKGYMRDVFQPMGDEAWEKSEW
ncbi:MULTISPECIES: hypothetical protein [Pseudomonas]|uniref:Uncharacterized protein n=1 Tax=Pseudomonas izuensis TaxID=2684212 RepID=A0ABM7RP41_9PSED|nr:MULTISPECIES: hypothetical protein [Pseudomonas]RKS28779.1 hypothetical protein BJ917_1680 [Pseudomonas sp. WPR_5_2]BCX66983.1 hypothetical protein LAB08_R16070 [Pseudomonas izuensis]